MAKRGIPPESPLWTRARRRREEAAAAQAQAAAPHLPPQDPPKNADSPTVPVAPPKSSKAPRARKSTFEIVQGGEQRSILVERRSSNETFEISPASVPDSGRVAMKKKSVGGLKSSASIRQVDSDAPGPHVRWAEVTRLDNAHPNTSRQSGLTQSVGNRMGPYMRLFDLSTASAGWSWPFQTPYAKFVSSVSRLG